MQTADSPARLRWPALLAMAVNLGLALSYIGLWFIASRDQLLWRADFSAFYTGGALIRDGLSRQLYDLELQAQYQQNILGGRSFSQDVLPYNYPPHLALLFTPLSLLSLSQAFYVWTFLQACLTAALIILIIRITHHWKPFDRWLLITAILALPGLLRSILLGAFSVWMLLCLLGWYAALHRRADRWAGFWLLFGTTKPQILVSPGLVSLAGRRWQTIFVMFLGGIVFIIVIGLSFGWKVWLDFFQRIIASGSYYNEYGINPAAMYNLKGTLTLWLGNSQSGWINALSLAGFLFSIILTAWMWWGKWDVDQPVFPLRLAFTLLLGIFFGLHVNLQDGLLLAAPAILFYEYLRQRGLPQTPFAILALSCPTLFLLDEFFLSTWLPIRVAVIFTLVMLVWSAILLKKENGIIVPSY